MRSNIISSAFSLAVLVSPDLMAKEHLLEISRSEAGDYKAELRIAPKKFKELCVPLKKGERVDWLFSAPIDTSFNIHYHVGSEVTYPAKVEGIRSARGTLEVAADQPYCWLWKAGSESLELAVSLKLLAPERK